MQKLVIITFEQLNFPTASMVSEEFSCACGDVVNVAMPESNWQRNFNYAGISGKKLSPEADSVYGFLVGDLMLHKGSVIFDLRSRNGLIPHNGSQIFNSFAHHSSLDPCAALIDENQSPTEMLKLFDNEFCYHRPKVSNQLCDIIEWFENIDNLMAA